MLSKTLGVLAILASSVPTSSAAVYTECLLKKDVYGPGASGTDFEYANADLNKDFTPLEYKVCLDGRNNVALVNVQFTYANADKSERFTTP